jgi:hypothetical protein
MFVEATLGGVTSFGWGGACGGLLLRAEFEVQAHFLFEIGVELFASRDRRQPSPEFA